MKKHSATKDAKVVKSKVKQLSARDAATTKGGGKRAGGTAGGNVAGGWDLLANKVHS